VASAKITFTISGLPVQMTGTTDRNGFATVSFKVPARTSTGQYTIVASFAGTDEIEGVMGDGLLTSKP
jgi:hypothetical protein